MKTITATLEWSKAGYGVWFDEFPGVFSFGKTVEEAQINAREALTFSFEDAKDMPPWIMEGFNIDIVFDAAGLLNHYQHIFTKRALSRITGINESLLSQYAMGLKKPRPTQSKKIQDGLHRLAKELQTVCLV